MDTNAAWEKLVNGIAKNEKKNKFQSVFTYWAAAAVVLLILSTGAVQWFLSAKTYEAPFGKVGYALLPDSSRVTLNAGTVIEHKQNGWNRKRVVKLKGEALFDVKKTKTDFVVLAGKHSVRVVGTRFNVYFRNNILDVKCISGSVEVVTENNQKQLLNAGQGVRFEPETESLREVRINTDRVESWTMGEYYFSQSPLSLVFDEMERQFNMKIIARGFEPQKRIYTGYFSNHEVNAALYLVCTPMGLTYSIDTKARVIEISPQQ
jgi:ferric-dicitrate binding protein FerR (iron transport regulator)